MESDNEFKASDEEGYKEPPDPKYMEPTNYDPAVGSLKYLMPNLAWDTEEMAATSNRWSKMMVELTRRCDQNFTFTTFESAADEMVIIKNIPLVTLCAHHLVPFIGTVDIAYVPDGKIAGLSKFPRLVKWLGKGAWNQEDLTARIADELSDKLRPVGVGVIVTAEHLCMTIRGVQTPGTTTITSAMVGCFADHAKQARAEFINLRK